MARAAAATRRGVRRAMGAGARAAVSGQQRLARRAGGRRRPQAQLRPTTSRSTSQTPCARWNGEGAVRLLAHDPERRALLIERCRPGTHALGARRRRGGTTSSPAFCRASGSLRRRSIRLARRRRLRAGSTSCPVTWERLRPSVRAAPARRGGRRRSASFGLAAGARRRGERGPPRRATSCARAARAMARDRSQAARGRARRSRSSRCARPRARSSCRRSAPAERLAVGSTSCSRTSSSSTGSAYAAGRSRTRSPGDSTPSASSPSTHGDLREWLARA